MTETVTAAVVEPIEMNWFQKLMMKIMAVITKLLIKLGIKLG